MLKPLVWRASISKIASTKNCWYSTVILIQNWRRNFDDARSKARGEKCGRRWHFWGWAAEKKRFSLGRCWKKTRMCTGTATAARKKSERRNAWECRLLEIEEVPSGNNENAIKWSLACVLRTSDFMKFVIKNETLLLAWVLRIMKMEISTISKIEFPLGTSEKCIIIEKAFTGARILMLPVPAQECFLWDVMRIPERLLRKTSDWLGPNPVLLIICLVWTQMVREAGI